MTSAYGPSADKLYIQIQLNLKRQTGHGSVMRTVTLKATEFVSLERRVCTEGLTATYSRSLMQHAKMTYDPMVHNAGLNGAYLLPKELPLITGHYSQ